MPSCDGDVCVMDEEPVIERQAGVPVLSPAIKPIISGVANSNRIPFIRRGAAQVMPAGTPIPAGFFGGQQAWNRLNADEQAALTGNASTTITAVPFVEGMPEGFPGGQAEWNRLNADIAGSRTTDSQFVSGFNSILEHGATSTKPRDEAYAMYGTSDRAGSDSGTTVPVANADGVSASKLADIAAARADAANAANFGQPANRQTGLTTAQTSLITGGINAGVAAIGSILNFVGQNASRDQQMEMAQMQLDLQRGNQEMQAAQAAGNRALQLQLAQMQNDRLERTANLAAAAGAEDTAQQLQLLRRQNQELIAGQRVTSQLMTDGNNTNTGVPAWALIAGTIAFVAVGAGVIYWVATKDDSEEAEAEEYPRSLAQRRLANKRNLYRKY